MGLGRCRVCGSGKVWRSSVWRYHILRALVNSSRRYCGACQERWISTETVQSSPRRKLFLTAVCVSIAGVVFCGTYLLLRHPSRPGKAGKTAKAKGAGDANKKSRSGGGTQGVASDGDNAAGEALTGEEGSEGAIAGMLRAGGGDGKAGWSSLAGDAASLAVGQAMGMLKGGSLENGPSSTEVEKMDKKELWDKYGHMFGSKEDAKKTYNEYLEKKKQQEAGGGGEPASEEGPPPEQDSGRY